MFMATNEGKKIHIKSEEHIWQTKKCTDVFFFLRLFPFSAKGLNATWLNILDYVEA